MALDTLHHSLDTVNLHSFLLHPIPCQIKPHPLPLPRPISQHHRQNRTPPFQRILSQLPNQMRDMQTRERVTVHGFCRRRHNGKSGDDGRANDIGAVGTVFFQEIKLTLGDAELLLRCWCWCQRRCDGVRSRCRRIRDRICVCTSGIVLPGGR